MTEAVATVAATTAADVTTPAASTAADVTTPAASTAGDFDFGKYITDETELGYVKNKGWKTPGDLLGSYRNAEKLIGADPASVLKMPKGDAPPEAWNEIYDKLGRPADPKEYNFAVPEGMEANQPLIDALRPAFHEIGIPKGMAEKLVAKYNEIGGTMAAEQAAAVQTQQTEAMSALQKEWGAAFADRSAVVDRAATAFGLDSAKVEALGNALGRAEAMKFLHNIGSKLGEADFVSGDGKQGFGGAMAPDQAKARIAELRKDVAWTGRFTSGDTAAKKEWTDLHKWAFPEEV